MSNAPNQSLTPHLGDLSERKSKPHWLRANPAAGDTLFGIKRTLRELSLHTVCEEAKCPNISECWNAKTATLMILGDICTRGCRFCSVKTGSPMGKVDPHEPEKVARTVREMALKYVVLTMVDRDDLPDGGAFHVARVVGVGVVGQEGWVSPSLGRG